VSVPQRHGARGALTHGAGAAARQVERQNKPEVEYNVHPELMLPPVRARTAAHA
jgi:hypothetical protein